jgi:ribosome maturation factor RimP
MLELKNDDSLVHVPISKESSNTKIQVKAIKDGKGGVTLSLESRFSNTQTRVLKVGEIQEIDLLAASSGMDNKGKSYIPSKEGPSESFMRGWK